MRYYVCMAHKEHGNGAALPRGSVLEIHNVSTGVPMINIRVTRYGDWYEAFHADAERLAHALPQYRIAYDATRKRLNCGIPYHAVYNAQAELAQRGIRLTIVEDACPTAPLALTR